MSRECPWSGWAPPNVDWCEEELCSWVVNPADSVSNLAYIGFGLLMIRQARGHKASDIVGLFGPASILVGLLSFAYHASHTYFFQFFDFVGMFGFCWAPITANALRLEWIRPGARLPFYAAGVAICSALVPIVSETPLPIQTLVALLIAVVLVQELSIARQQRTSSPATQRRLFFLALGLLAAAGLASLADITRTWCQPTNHWIQGHAVWHVLSAAALYALFRFYQQLPPPRPAPERAGASAERDLA